MLKLNNQTLTVNLKANDPNLKKRGMKAQVLENTEKSQVPSGYADELADLVCIGYGFAAALLVLPRLFGTNPRSHHKGATGRVRTGNQLHPVLCHCQLGQDIPITLFSCGANSKVCQKYLTLKNSQKYLTEEQSDPTIPLTKAEPALPRLRANWLQIRETY